MTPGLSILDQSTIASGRGADEAIRETLELARLADAWGYRRYWLAEHHNSEAHAGAAPEMLVAAMGPTRGASASARPASCCRTTPP